MQDAFVIDADGQTPLLYILQNDLALRGARFGCGLAQCGSCSVLVDDREVRACITPLAAVAGRAITTLEGVAAWHARRRDLARVPDMHPVQQALLEAEAPQCGYCMNGIVMKSAELLDRIRSPPRNRYAPRWPVTCAAAAPTLLSCAPCRRRPGHEVA